VAIDVTDNYNQGRIRSRSPKTSKKAAWGILISNYCSKMDEAYSRYYLGMEVLRKTTKNISQDTDVPVENQTKHFQNTATQICLVVVPKIRTRSPPGNRTPSRPTCSHSFYSVIIITNNNKNINYYTTASLKHQQTRNRDFFPCNSHTRTCNSDAC
jgi:hypothetical protein